MGGMSHNALFPNAMDSMAPTEQRQTSASLSNPWPIGDMQLDLSVNVANTIVSSPKRLCCNLSCNLISQFSSVSCGDGVHLEGPSHFPCPTEVKEGRPP